MTKSRIRIFVVITILTIVSTNVFAQTVQFEQKLSWSQLLEKARRENKYIMVDVMATWCGPCKQMERTVFSRQEVADSLHGKFIAVRLQADETDSDADQIKKMRSDAKLLLSAYKINAFPTILFLSPDGTLVHRTTGASGVREFLQDVSIAANPQLQYPSLIKRYNAGQRDFGLVDMLVKKAWFEAANDSLAQRISNDFVSTLPNTAIMSKDTSDLISFMVACSHSPERGFSFTSLQKKFDVLKDNYKQGNLNVETVMPLAYISRWLNDSALETRVAQQYISSLPKDKVFNKRNLEFIKQFTKSTKDKGFRILFENRKRVNQLMGDHFVQEAVCPLIHEAEIRPLLKTGSLVNWDSLSKTIIANYREVGREEIIRSKFYFAARGVLNEVMPNAIQEAITYFSQYGQYDIANSNAVAWYFFQYRTDKSELEKALQWSKTVIKKEPTTNYYDTYANLLYKLGKRDEAIKVMEKGFALPLGNGNIEEIKSNYEKMKKGLPTWIVPAKN